MVPTPLGRRSDLRPVACFAIVILAFAALLGTVPARAADTAAPASGTQTLQSSAPDFTAVGVDGKTYKLSELLKQGPVLLDFWTTWCVPCMLEMPKLQDVWKRHRDQGFTLVGIPSDDQKTAAKVKGKIQSMGFQFPNVPDPTRKIGNSYNVRNFPTTVLIAPDGKIVKVAQGYNPGDEKDWESRIVAILGPDKAGATEGK